MLVKVRRHRQQRLYTWSQTNYFDALPARAIDVMGNAITSIALRRLHFGQEISRVTI